MRVGRPKPWIKPSHSSAVGVNRLLRPSRSDCCIDYHVSIWKMKITADETGADLEIDLRILKVDCKTARASLPYLKICTCIKTTLS